MKISNSLFQKKVYQILQNLQKEIPKIKLNNNHNNYSRQISARNFNFEVCKYQKLDINFLNNFDYTRIKNYWCSYTLENKSDIFLNAVDKLNTKYKDEMIACTMYSQNKTYEEAEKDSIIDLSNNLHNIILKINDIYKKNQEIQYKIDYQPLEGFIGVSTIYNSNNISNILGTIPTLFGNIVLWNPDPNSILTNHLFYKILIECGLPKSVLSFLPLERQLFHKMIINNKNLGIIINDSYNGIYSNIMNDLNKNYLHQNYNFNPKIILNKSGNNFHFFEKTVCNNDYLFEKAIKDTFNSAFQFSGQNYNSCKRIYLPFEYFEKFLSIFKHLHNNLNQDNYSMINKKKFKKATKTLELYCDNILLGGKTSCINKYYIQPTLLLSENEECDLLKKNFEAPILTLCLYNSNKVERAMMKCNETSINCLTGSIYTKNEIYKRLSKKIFTNVKEILLMNKDCNINYFNSNILGNFYTTRFID